MNLDILTIGEALVEIMRTDIDQPLDQPGPFTGPYPSGAPFIFAAQAARLGRRVGAIGAVGADAFGDCLLRQLAADGIESAGVHKLEGRTTGAAFVSYRADGGRDYVFSLGAGGQLRRDMLTPALFAGLRCFHVMGSTLSISAEALAVCREALHLALAAGALISFDPNLRPELLPLDRARGAFAPFIEAADVFLPTEAELLGLTGALSIESAAEQLLRGRPERLIVVTRGAAGCSLISAQGRADIAGFAVDEIDPTGAGDCFDAAFLSALLAGTSPVARRGWQMLAAAGGDGAGADGRLADTRRGRAMAWRSRHATRSSASSAVAVDGAGRDANGLIVATSSSFSLWMAVLAWLALSQPLPGPNL